MYCPDFIGCEIAEGDSAGYVIDGAESYGIAVEAYGHRGIVPRVPFRFEAFGDGSVIMQYRPYPVTSAASAKSIGMQSFESSGISSKRARCRCGSRNQTAE